MDDHEGRPGPDDVTGTDPIGADTGTASRAVDVLVVGAGVAGLRTVAALRARGHDGSIALVGAEAEAPYDRTTLSVDLFTRASPPDLAAEGLGDLDELGAQWWPGLRAATIASDDDGAVVELRPSGAVPAGSGSPVAAEDRPTRVRARRVVVATGARAVTPPWPATRTLRSAADAAHLRAAVGPGTRLVVVGAGWIGTELAGAAAAAGARVMVLEAAGQPLGHAPDVLAEHARPWFAEAGVELVTGAEVASVDAAAGGGQVVTLAGGRELAADVVVAALGAVPETEWLGALTPRGPGGHVLVDAGGRSQGPAWLWAVGDAAAIDAGDVVVPGAHWESALRHPDAVAASVLGLPLPDLPAPYVFSEQLGHDLAIVGTPVGSPGVVRRDDAGTTWLWTDTNGRLVAGATADHPRDVPPLRRALAGGGRPELDPVVAADPTRRLRDAITRR
ncbi:MAG: FAD-dependent oxidoreductase [Actinomycetaceae bacterium]